MQRKLLGAQFPIHRQTTTMNSLSVLLSTAAALSAVKAASINHDKVQPFAQPEPTTISAKAAVKDKPSLRIDMGCNNYGDCEGSSLGSQVYGRGVWHNDLWAIMYFPKDMPTTLFKDGRRYDWVNAVAASIGHDKVQPNSQPEPVTEAEKAAVEYKPSLRIDSGCHPYATVDTAGNTNAGLKGSGSSSGECKGSGLGSQVYGRAVWYNDLWAIMYAWYFPKDSASITAGHRHDWVNVVVWLNSPAQDKSMILGVSTSSYGEKYYKYLPLPAGALNGTSAMINYLADGGNGGYHTVDVTGRTGGKFQDLIMWEQLTVEARTALTDTSFGEKAKVPFIDANFDANLKAAWPY